ncbi:YceI family protein [Saccharopolyspora sp. ASAGF58]|uniref:YceI family protein n=1 Tax=Saccharopolyspora sp. ASAGF58 TaxID=2719023 RepID=UPI00143FBECF|nr:YceI family protein [Saccharopolyspora sp. ASAGF58]QIZ34727.1 YceI family protein [Saccharopolyspora sp. ASAGF58]
MSHVEQKFTGTFVADPAHSSVQFSVRHMKVAIFRTTFEEIAASIISDENGIRVEGAVPVESISIRKPAEFREHVVYSPEFFDAKNHKDITFTSADIVLNDDGTCSAHTELTIKGISRPVSATGTYSLPIDDPFGFTRAGVELVARVDRRDWDLNWQAPLPGGGDALGYEVDIDIYLDVVKES